MASNELRMSRSNKKNILFNDNIKELNKLEYLYDPRVLEDGAKRVFEIDKQNMELLKTLNLIRRTKGKTNCWRTEITDDNIVESKESKRKEIAKENKNLYNRIRTSVGRYSVAKMERDWEKSRILIQNKSKSFPLKNTEAISTNKKLMEPSKTYQFTIPKRPNLQKYPHCYFELQLVEQNRKLGKIIFEIYADIVPKTSENFIKLCTGINGISYKNTPLHRIVTGYLCQGGDVTKFNGSGGTSIYGGDFDDENFILKHATPGMLSMWNSGKNTNNSKFNLTFKKLEILDGKNVVFGRIVNGLSIIYEIDAMGTKIGKPKKTIIISKCGLC